MLQKVLLVLYLYFLVLVGEVVLLLLALLPSLLGFPIAVVGSSSPTVVNLILSLTSHSASGCAGFSWTLSPIPVPVFLQRNCFVEKTSDFCLHLTGWNLGPFLIFFRHMQSSSHCQTPYQWLEPLLKPVFCTFCSVVHSKSSLFCPWTDHDLFSVLNQPRLSSVP